MSLVFEGRMHTFSPRTYLTRADITVIRPMIYVYEKDIITIARQLELPVIPNNCPADGVTKRHAMKEELSRLEAHEFHCPRTDAARRYHLSLGAVDATRSRPNNEAHQKNSIN